MIEAFRNLVEEHGKSFAPEQVLPSYDLHFDGPKVLLAVGGHTIEEHVSEWKRAAGRLWALASFPPDQAAIVIANLPTLSVFNGAVWAPMERLVEAPSVSAAVETLADGLAKDQPMEALLCRHSASFANMAPGVDLYEAGPGAKERDEAFATKGALSAMALVKLSLAHLGDDDPVERLRSLIWLREAMRENPAAVLGIHRLLVSEVVPLARTGVGLWREAALSVLERWVTKLVARGAFPEALPLLELLLAYGVGVPTMLALRHETLLCLGDDEEAERTFGRLASLADANGHLRAPLNRVDQHIDDVRAVALWRVAKLLRQIAEDEPPFTERRLKKEPLPPEVNAKDAARRSKAHALRAKALLERRAGEPKVLAYPLNHGFYLGAVTKLLA